MKSNTLFLLAVAVAIVSVIITVFPKKTTMPSAGTRAGNIIPPAEAKKMLDKDSSIFLLDVRTPEEYEAGHIPKSVLIPVDDLEATVESKLPDKNRVVIVYCRSGRRSALTVEILLKKNYQKVYDMGGINDWPYEIVKGK